MTDSTVGSVRYLDIAAFPGYRVGDDGSVWSRWWRRMLGGRRGSQRVMGKHWRRLAGVPDKKGRIVFNLCRSGKVFKRFAHHLVLEAFVGPRPAGMECCHFPDRDPSSNKLSNLRWDTKLANAADKRAHGTHPSGERNGNAELTAADVTAIRTDLAAGRSRKAIAEEYGVGRTTIDALATGETWAGRPAEDWEAIRRALS